MPPTDPLWWIGQSRTALHVSTRANDARETDANHPQRLPLRRLHLIYCIALLLTACTIDNDVLVDAYSHIDDSKWSSSDRKTFALDTVEKTGDYRLSVRLRTTSEVEFQKIYVVVEQQLHNPMLRSRDTVVVQLTNEQGVMLEKGVDLYNYVVPLDKAIRLHKGQSGEVALSHVMRRTQLKGITDVGVKIEYEDSGH